MPVKKSTQHHLRQKAYFMFPGGIIVLSLFLFLPAGSFAYWQAWIYITIVFSVAIFIVTYFLKHDPELLNRRMRFKEKALTQKRLIKISWLFFSIGFLVPGLDFRYGWSQVPLWLVITADILVFLGYLLVFFVFKENSYASRIVEVTKEQKVITTGPYSVIRHPMYAGVLIMYLLTPIALGSYYALIFFVPIIGIIVLRILNEEKLLTRDLRDYKAYCQKVKYRIIPGIW